MMVDPLFRLPCILIAMVGLNTTVTPPHPPPRAEETVPSTLEALLKQRVGPVIVKSISWGFALAEMTVIIASKFPEYELSKRILSTFVISGSAQSIQMTKWFLIGTFMTAFGGYIRWSCYRALGRFFTFEMCIRKEHKLVTQGPYAWVRHPGYTGVLSTFIGLGIWHASKGSYARECGLLNSYAVRGAVLVHTALVASIISGLLLRMPKEDDTLKETFGAQWDEWARRVPYKLIPGIC